MWKLFFILISGIILSLPCGAQSAKSSQNITAIESSFQDAFEFVQNNKLEAPEASRIYALTAIALHDAYEVSHFGNSYFEISNISKSPLTNTLMKDTIRELLKLEATNLSQKINFEDYSNESPANILAFSISSQIPKLKPTKYINSGLWDSDNIIPVSPNWKHSKLLELYSADQFRPDGPPDINSETFQTAREEVFLYGGEFSQIRGSENAFTARLWMGAAGSVTSPGHWNRIALTQTQDMDTKQRLKILLALNIAMYDSGIAAWDTKYHFNFLRPDTAIALLNSETDWYPMAQTPHHPEYVSGHSTFSGAAATVLTRYLGEVPFCATFEDAWSLEKCYDSYWHAAREAGQSRIYGGLHFSFSNTDGLELGRKVSNHVMTQIEGKF